MTCSNVTRENPPNCDCTTGLYDDGVSPTCYSCSHKCGSCDPSDKDACTSCAHLTR